MEKFPVMGVELPAELSWLAVPTVGQDWPTGDEDGLAGVGLAWQEAEVAFVALEGGLGAAVAAMRNAVEGGSADAFERFADVLVEYVPVFRRAAGQLGDFARGTAVEVQYAKYMIVSQVLWLFYEVAAAIKSAWVSGGMSLLLLPGLFAAARVGVAMVLRRLALSVAHGVAFQVGMDVVVQLAQFARGDRTAWDGDKTGFAAGLGAAGGVLGGVLGVVVDRVAPGFSPTALSQLVQGTVTEFGVDVLGGVVTGQPVEVERSLLAGFIGSLGVKSPLDGVSLPPDLRSKLRPDLSTDLRAQLDGLFKGGTGETGVDRSKRSLFGTHAESAEPEQSWQHHGTGQVSPAGQTLQVGELAQPGQVPEAGHIPEAAEDAGAGQVAEETEQIAGGVAARRAPVEVQDDESWRHFPGATADWMAPAERPLHRDQWAHLREQAPITHIESELTAIAVGSPVRTDAKGRPAVDIASEIVEVRHDVRRMEVEPGRWVKEFTLKVHLDPESGVDHPQLDNVMRNAERGVDRMYNQGYRMPDGDQFHVRLEWVRDPDEAYQRVQVLRNHEWSSYNRWDVGLSAQDIAHELGHYGFGLFDAYRHEGIALQNKLAGAHHRGAGGRLVAEVSNRVVDDADSGLMSLSHLPDTVLRPRELWQIGRNLVATTKVVTSAPHAPTTAGTAEPSLFARAAAGDVEATITLADQGHQESLRAVVRRAGDGDQRARRGLVELAAQGEVHALDGLARAGDTAAHPELGGRTVVEVLAEMAVQPVPNRQAKVLLFNLVGDRHVPALELAARHGDDRARNELRGLARAGDPQAFTAMVSNEDVPGLAALAESGRADAHAEVKILAGQGNLRAVTVLRDAGDVAALVVAATAPGPAYEAVRVFARQGDAAALDKITAVGDVPLLIELASAGLQPAYAGLKALAIRGNQLAVAALHHRQDVAGLVEVAQGGNAEAYVAVKLLAGAGNQAAVESLVQVGDVHGLIEVASAQGPAFDAVKQFAAEGNAAALARVAHSGDLATPTTATENRVPRADAVVSSDDLPRQTPVRTSEGGDRQTIEALADLGDVDAHRTAELEAEPSLTDIDRPGAQARLFAHGPGGAEVSAGEFAELTIHVLGQAGRDASDVPAVVDTILPVVRSGASVTVSTSPASHPTAVQYAEQLGNALAEQLQPIERSPAVGLRVLPESSRQEGLVVTVGNAREAAALPVGGQGEPQPGNLVPPQPVLGAPAALLAGMATETQVQTVADPGAGGAQLVPEVAALSAPPEPLREPDINWSDPLPDPVPESAWAHLLAALPVRTVAEWAVKPQANRDSVTAPEQAVRQFVGFDLRRFEVAHGEPGQRRWVREHTVRLHLQAGEGVSTADLRAVAATALAGVREHLNQGHRFRAAHGHGSGDQFHLNLVFIDVSELAHASVTVHPAGTSGEAGTGALSQFDWHLGARPVDLAHEMLRFIGLDKDYVHPDQPATGALSLTARVLELIDQRTRYLVSSPDTEYRVIHSSEGQVERSGRLWAALGERPLRVLAQTALTENPGAVSSLAEQRAATLKDGSELPDSALRHTMRGWAQQAAELIALRAAAGTPALVLVVGVPGEAAAGPKSLCAMTDVQLAGVAQQSLFRILRAELVQAFAAVLPTFAFALADMLPVSETPMDLMAGELLVRLREPEPGESPAAAGYRAPEFGGPLAGEQSAAPVVLARAVAAALAQPVVDTATLFAQLHRSGGGSAETRALELAFRAETGDDLAQAVTAAVSENRLSDEDFEHVLELLGLHTTLFADPRNEAPIPSTAVPPGIDPATLPPVRDAAFKLWARIMAGQRAEALTQLRELNRDPRTIMAVERAYAQMFGGRFGDQLAALVPREGDYLDHLLGKPSAEPVPEQLAVQWHRRLAESTFNHHAFGPLPVPSGHPEDGCYMRAHLWALQLIQWGADPRKIFVARWEPPLAARTATALNATEDHPVTVNWGYHTAPAVRVVHSDGQAHWVVLDPALSAEPLTVLEWLQQAGVTEPHQHFEGNLDTVLHLLDTHNWLFPDAWSPRAEGPYPRQAMTVITDVRAFYFPHPALGTSLSVMETDTEARQQEDELACYAFEDMRRRLVRELKVVLASDLEGLDLLAEVRRTVAQAPPTLGFLTSHPDLDIELSARLPAGHEDELARLFPPMPSMLPEFGMTSTALPVDDNVFGEVGTDPAPRWPPSREQAEPGGPPEPSGPTTFDRLDTMARLGNLLDRIGADRRLASRSAAVIQQHIKDRQELVEQVEALLPNKTTLVEEDRKKLALRWSSFHREYRSEQDPERKAELRHAFLEHVWELTTARTSAGALALPEAFGETGALSFYASASAVQEARNALHASSSLARLKPTGILHGELRKYEWMPVSEPQDGEHPRQWLLRAEGQPTGVVPVTREEPGRGTAELAADLVAAVRLGNPAVARLAPIERARRLHDLTGPAPAVDGYPPLFTEHATREVADHAARQLGLNQHAWARPGEWYVVAPLHDEESARLARVLLESEDGRHQLVLFEDRLRLVSRSPGLTFFDSVAGPGPAMPMVVVGSPRAATVTRTVEFDPEQDGAHAWAPVREFATELAALERWREHNGLPPATIRVEATTTEDEQALAEPHLDTAVGALKAALRWETQRQLDLGRWQGADRLTQIATAQDVLVSAAPGSPSLVTFTVDSAEPRARQWGIPEQATAGKEFGQLTADVPESTRQTAVGIVGRYLTTPRGQVSRTARQFHEDMLDVLEVLRTDGESAAEKLARTVARQRGLAPEQLPARQRPRYWTDTPVPPAPVVLPLDSPATGVGRRPAMARFIRETAGLAVLAHWRGQRPPVVRIDRTAALSAGTRLTELITELKAGLSTELAAYQAREPVDSRITADQIRIELPEQTLRNLSRLSMRVKPITAAVTLSVSLPAEEAVVRTPSTTLTESEWSGLRHLAPVTTVWQRDSVPRPVNQVSENAQDAGGARLELTGPEGTGSGLALVTGLLAYDVQRIQARDVSPGGPRAPRQTVANGHVRLHTIRIHLTGGDDQVTSLRGVAAAAVEEYFNQGYLFDDGDQFHLDVRFVDDPRDAHVRVRAQPANFRQMDQFNWSAGATARQIAHELGHFLGLRDEYAVSDGLGTVHQVPRPGRVAQDDYSLMGEQRGSQVGLRHRHLERLDRQARSYSPLHDGTLAVLTDLSKGGELDQQTTLLRTRLQERSLSFDLAEVEADFLVEGRLAPDSRHRPALRAAAADLADALVRNRVLHTTGTPVETSAWVAMSDLQQDRAMLSAFRGELRQALAARWLDRAGELFADVAWSVRSADPGKVSFNFSFHTRKHGGEPRALGSGLLRRLAGSLRGRSTVPVLGPATRLVVPFVTERETVSERSRDALWDFLQPIARGLTTNAAAAPPEVVVTGVDRMAPERDPVIGQLVTDQVRSSLKLAIALLLPTPGWGQESEFTQRVRQLVGSVAISTRDAATGVIPPGVAEYRSWAMVETRWPDFPAEPDPADPDATTGPVLDDGERFDNPPRFSPGEPTAGPATESWFERLFQPSAEPLRPEQWRTRLEDATAGEVAGGDHGFRYRARRVEVLPGQVLLHLTVPVQAPETARETVRAEIAAHLNRGYRLPGGEQLHVEPEFTANAGQAGVEQVLAGLGLDPAAPAVTPEALWGLGRRLRAAGLPALDRVPLQLSLAAAALEAAPGRLPVSAEPDATEDLLRAEGGESSVLLHRARQVLAEDLDRGTLRHAGRLPGEAAPTAYAAAIVGELDLKAATVLLSAIGAVFGAPVVVSDERGQRWRIPSPGAGGRSIRLRWDSVGVSAEPRPLSATARAELRQQARELGEHLHRAEGAVDMALLLTLLRRQWKQVPAREVWRAVTAPDPVTGVPGLRVFTPAVSSRIDGTERAEVAGLPRLDLFRRYFGPGGHWPPTHQDAEALRAVAGRGQEDPAGWLPLIHRLATAEAQVDPELRRVGGSRGLDPEPETVPPGEEVLAVRIDENCLDVAMAVYATWYGDPQPAAISSSYEALSRAEAWTSQRAELIGMLPADLADTARRDGEAEDEYTARLTAGMAEARQNLARVVSALDRAGPGAAAIVVGMGPFGGHAWNAVNLRGTVYWADGQLNLFQEASETPEWMLDQADILNVIVSDAQRRPVTGYQSEPPAALVDQVAEHGLLVVTTEERLADLAALTGNRQPKAGVLEVVFHQDRAPSFEEWRWTLDRVSDWTQRQPVRHPAGADRLVRMFLPGPHDHHLRTARSVARSLGVRIEFGHHGVALDSAGSITAESVLRFGGGPGRRRGPRSRSLVSPEEDFLSGFFTAVLAAGDPVRVPTDPVRAEFDEVTRQLEGESAVLRNRVLDRLQAEVAEPTGRFAPFLNGQELMDVITRVLAGEADPVVTSVLAEATAEVLGAPVVVDGVGFGVQHTAPSRVLDPVQPDSNLVVSFRRGVHTLDETARRALADYADSIAAQIRDLEPAQEGSLQFTVTGYGNGGRRGAARAMTTAQARADVTAVALDAALGRALARTGQRWDITREQRGGQRAGTPADRRIALITLNWTAPAPRSAVELGPRPESAGGAPVRAVTDVPRWAGPEPEARRTEADFAETNFTGLGLPVSAAEAARAHVIRLRQRAVVAESEGRAGERTLLRAEVAFENIALKARTGGGSVAAHQRRAVRLSALDTAVNAHSWRSGQELRLPHTTIEVSGHATALRSAVRDQDATRAGELLSGLRRELRALWAVQDAYREHFGAELATELLSIGVDAGRLGHLLGRSSAAPVAREDLASWLTRLRGERFDLGGHQPAPLPHHYPDRGAHLRAHHVAMRLAEWGAQPYKIFFTRQQPLRLSATGREVRLPYYVAVAVRMATAARARWMVLDPTHAGEPLSVPEWLAHLGADDARIERHAGPLESVLARSERSGHPDSWQPGGAVIITEPHAYDLPVPGRPQPRSWRETDLRVRFHEHQLARYREEAARHERAHDIRTRLVEAAGSATGSRAGFARWVEEIREHELFAVDPRLAEALRARFPGSVQAIQELAEAPVRRRAPGSLVDSAEYPGSLRLAEEADRVIRAGRPEAVRTLLRGVEHDPYTYWALEENYHARTDRSLLEDVPGLWDLLATGQIGYHGTGPAAGLVPIERWVQHLLAQDERLGREHPEVRLILNVRASGRPDQDNGHAWLGIRLPIGIPGERPLAWSRELTFGFWPEAGWDLSRARLLGGSSMPGEVRSPDEAGPPTWRREEAITAKDAARLLVFTRGAQRQSYQLYTSNCATFAQRAFAVATGKPMPNRVLPSVTFPDRIQWSSASDGR